MSDYNTIKGLDRARYEALINAEILHPLPQNAVLVIGADWCPDTQRSIMDSGYPTQTKDGRPIVYLNDANPETHKILRTFAGKEILGGGVDSELPPSRPTREYNYPTVVATRDGALTQIIYADTVPEGGLLYPTELGNFWQKQLQERAQLAERPKFDPEKAAPLFDNALPRTIDEATLKKVETIEKLDVRELLAAIEAMTPAQRANNQKLADLYEALKLPKGQEIETLHGMVQTRAKLIEELPGMLDPNSVYAVVSSNCGHCHELLARGNYPRTTEDGRPITYLNLAVDAQGKPQNMQAYTFYTIATLNGGMEVEGFPTFITTDGKGTPSIAAAGTDPILEQFFPSVVQAEAAKSQPAPAPSDVPETPPLPAVPAAPPPGVAANDIADLGKSLGEQGVSQTPRSMAHGPLVPLIGQQGSGIVRNG